jgi:MoxR-like ATPase
VTVDGVSRALPEPFLVLATQNPIELEGTFPLPEAQLDRFLVRVGLGYPDTEAERAILQRFRDADPLADLQPVASAAAILALGRQCRSVYVSPAVETYLLNLTRTTRSAAALALGASPRASLSLYRASQALAAIHGRTFVQPDEVQALVGPVLAHRLIPSQAARLRSRSVNDILAELVAQVPVPVEESWSEPAVL